MSVSDALSPLSAGLAALAEGRWAEAREPLQAAVALDPSAPALEALGHAYFWTDHPDTINVRERAYRAHRDHGDSRGAARVATALAFDLITFQGETAVGQGWLELAGRALEREPLSPEHGHLAAWEADFAITHGDLTLAARKSEEAVSIGRQLGIRDVELIGRAQQGYLLVVQGRAAEGMRLLDASAAAAVAGEFTDRALGGYACCYEIGRAHV